MTPQHSNGIRVLCAALLGLGSMYAGGVTLTPQNPTVVTSQSQAFTASSPVNWALAAGSLGSLSASGVYTAPANVPTPPVAATCGIFPNNNVWNVPVDNLPVDPSSAAYINSMGPTATLHPDFTIPYTDVPGTQPKVPVTFVYASESDPGPYPIPANAPIEGGSNSNGDRHVIVVDHDNCVLYELYNAWPKSDGSWSAGGGAIFDLKSNALRPAGWTSADAAGLPLLPGLLRYDEVAAGEVRHAIRFTAPLTRAAYVWPARHYAATANGTQYPPMGQRFRLRAGFDISGFSRDVQVILRAMQKYGLILADNGAPWMFQGAPDPRWNMNDILSVTQVLGSNLEAVTESSLSLDPNTAQTTVNTAMVTASSGSLTGQSGVTVITPGNHVVAIGVTPTQLTLAPGATWQFSALVTGNPNTAVTWAISPQTGTISAGGLYTAPSNAAGQTVTVTATSAADPAKSASATVYLAANASASASLAFVSADGATQGSWQGVYGSGGFNVIGNAAQYPAYSTVTQTGASVYTWAASTSDTRALQLAPPGSGRIAAAWYSAGSFSVDLAFNDGLTHQVSLYFLDWDNQGRDQTLQITDGSGRVLDSRHVAGFSNGTYLTWSLSGHVTFQFSRVTGYSAVLSGIFFGGSATGPPPAPGTAVFVKTDATTAGSWKGAYGADGYNVIGDAQAYPAYAAVAAAGQASYTWASSSSDPRALQTASSTGRIAATWYTGASMSIDVNITDGKTHPVAIYCLDWDYRGRSQTVTVTDSNGATLDTRSVSNFSGGVYLVWNVSGHVRIVVTANAGPNAVVSGVFFGGGSASGTPVSFVRNDTGTQGNWQGIYGGSGYAVIGAAVSVPGSLSVTAWGQSSYTWTPSTGDTRALQVPLTTNRIAATWYGNTMIVDLNFTDTNTHQLAAYFVDWDYQGRAETVSITDTSGNTLDARKLANFSGGQYLVWNVTGHVRLQVNLTGGPNAVLSGLFFQ